MSDELPPQPPGPDTTDEHTGGWREWADSNPAPAPNPARSVPWRRNTALEMDSDPQVTTMTRGVTDRSVRVTGTVAGRGRGQPKPGSLRGRVPMGVLMVVGVIVVLVCLVIATSHVGSGPPAAGHPGVTVPTGAATSTAPSPAPAGADPWAIDGCVQHPTGGPVLSGTSAGSKDSAAGVIFGFYRAVLVVSDSPESGQKAAVSDQQAAQSGQAAAKFLVNGSVPASDPTRHWTMDAAELQRGVHTGLRPGTRYCLTITLAGSDSDAEVKVDTQAPGEQTLSYTAVIFTECFTGCLIGAIKITM